MSLPVSATSVPEAVRSPPPLPSGRADSETTPSSPWASTTDTVGWELSCRVIVAVAVSLSPSASVMVYWKLTSPSSPAARSEEHTSELQSRPHLVCRLLLEKKHTQQDHHA